MRFSGNDELGFERAHIHNVGLGVNIDEIDIGSAIPSCICRGDEGIWHGP